MTGEQRSLENPLFSVIIPTHGRPAYLNEALQSVLDQTIDDFEVVIVDDASPEPIGPMDDARIKVIRRTENGGAGAARSTGLASARGRYVTFLDDDDSYEPRRLEMSLEGLKRAPLSLCWMRRMGEKAEHTVRDRVLEGNVHQTILDLPIPHLGSVTIDRTLAPMFDPDFRLTQDVEWWIRVSESVPVTTVEEVGYRLRIHTGPRLSRQTARRLHFCLMLLDKHADYFAAHPRAAARQWKRAGVLAEKVSDFPEARKAFARSLRISPQRETLWHLARTLFRPPLKKARPGEKQRV